MIKHLLFIFITLFLFINCSQNGNDLQTDVNTPVDSLIITLVGEDEKSVFDILLESHQVESKSTIIGNIVISIDSLKSSYDYFWLYSVNDSMPDIAADKYLTKDGDIIKWHFRKGSK